jgi:hypothetical protein
VAVVRYAPALSTAGKQCCVNLDSHERDSIRVRPDARMGIASCMLKE